MTFIFLIFIIATIIIIIIIFMYRYINNKKDYFITPVNNSDTINIPVKTYSFLHDDNYSKIILDKYYVNDDFKINNTRVINHPYLYKTKQYYGNQRYVTNNNRIISDIIYITTGARI